ncbi:hypothetical protein BS47DRAFT_1370488 [Hydnum rufescens UP504]|uniref:Phosphotransferase n=1 Tax=Hydnum rufescens UP504 TaxID=1448309 RepID=A0A9P6E241_9AGAM|nr:hypothetical protein BS47DRAFT_1370488 [Hydnum rufescens UP504]
MPVVPSPNESAIPTATLRALYEIEQDFHLDATKLHSILEHFVADLGTGLGKYGHGMAMVPTFVTGVPTGKETGTFLALDLGGTNLRVCEVKLDGNHTFQLRQQKYKVSDDLKTGDAKFLFDYMADSLSVEQTALDKGTLLTWTKGFSATNAQGKDVVKMLQDALDRKHLHVKCVALVNDTVGTLLSRSYLVGDCLLGCIFGTGTNAAYLDDASTFTKSNDIASQGGKMIVNTEWGAFDNERIVLPFTEYDNKVDRESINPRFQAFEKFISGMYQGEVVRNVILHLIDKNLLFRGYSTPELNAHYGFDTSFMVLSQCYSVRARAENARTPEFYTRARKVFIEKLGFSKYTGPNSSGRGAVKFEITDADCEITRRVCETVATRAARLSAIGIAAVVQKTEVAKKTEGNIQVGVDGSMAEHYPYFEVRVREALRVVLGHEVEQRIKIGMAKDGSGVGG